MARAGAVSRRSLISWCSRGTRPGVGGGRPPRPSPAGVLAAPAGVDIPIELTAVAQHGNKQYIARITGRDARYTFAREFVGERIGAARDVRVFLCDEPGLYVTCDITAENAKAEAYHLVHQTGAGLAARPVTKTAAP